jgi:hypothetical protein
MFRLSIACSLHIVSTLLHFGTSCCFPDVKMSCHVASLADAGFQRYADDEMLLFKGCKNQNSSSIILRGRATASCLRCSLHIFFLFPLLLRSSACSLTGL